VILHIGHIEIQHNEIRLEDMQMVTVLQVLEQRTIRQDSRIHDLYRRETIVMTKPLFQLPSEDLIVARSKTEGERIAQKQNSNCPGGLWCLDFRRPQAKGIYVNPRTAEPGPQCVMFCPTPNPEAEVRGSLRR